MNGSTCTWNANEAGDLFHGRWKVTLKQEPNADSRAYDFLRLYQGCACSSGAELIGACVLTTARRLCDPFVSIKSAGVRPAPNLSRTKVGTGVR